MSRQLDQINEDRTEKRHQNIVVAVEFGLEQGVARSGGELHGLAFKLSPGECLLIIKAMIAGKKQVAFVGAEDLGGALIKGMLEANRDKLRWREDKYGG